MHAGVSSPATPPSRPRPIEHGSPGPGGLVPRGWLERAPVTAAVIWLNVTVFVVQLVVTGGHSLMHLPEREALIFGANDSLATVGEGRWETLITACFLHDGIMHLGFNMLALWQAGPLVEREVGSARMAPMYLASGAAGNALSVALAWLTRTARLTVGASGAISGVLAAALVVGWRVQGWRGPFTQAMLRWLGFIVVFGIVSRASGANIDNAAHAGGAAAGAIIALGWRRGRRYSRAATAAIVGACVAVVAACIVAVGVHDHHDPFAGSGLQERFDFAWK